MPDYRAYTLTATIVAPHDIAAADHALRTMLAALPDGDVLNAGVEFDDEGDLGLGCGLRLDLLPRPGTLVPYISERLTAGDTGSQAWTPSGQHVPPGADAIFTLPALAYRPLDGGPIRYREAYAGRLTTYWHDTAEFTTTADVLTAIAA